MASWAVSEYPPAGGHDDELQDLHVWCELATLNVEVPDARAGSRAYRENDSTLRVVIQSQGRNTAAAAEDDVLAALGELQQMLAADPFLGLNDDGVTWVEVRQTRIQMAPFDTRWVCRADVDVDFTAELLIP